MWFLTKIDSRPKCYYEKSLLLDFENAYDSLTLKFVLNSIKQFHILEQLFAISEITAKFLYKTAIHRHLQELDRLVVTASGENVSIKLFGIINQ